MNSTQAKGELLHQVKSLSFLLLCSAARVAKSMEKVILNMQKELREKVAQFLSGVVQRSSEPMAQRQNHDNIMTIGKNKIKVFSQQFFTAFYYFKIFVYLRKHSIPRPIDNGIP